MIRASEAFRIITNRLYNVDNELDISIKTLKESVEKKKEVFDINNLDKYIITNGLITNAKDVLKYLDLQKKFIEDELSEGIKNYIQEIFLEKEYGLEKYTKKDKVYSLNRGKFLENRGIKTLSEYLNIDIIKNTERFYAFDFLTGEPDIIYIKDGKKIIRDLKIPENWESFRNKEDMDIYYWQILSYMILTDAAEGYIDYILLGDKSILPEYYSNYSKVEEIVEKIPISNRIKTYSVTINDKVREDMEFLIKRINKCKEYYLTLDINKCLNKIF